MTAKSTYESHVKCKSPQQTSPTCGTCQAAGCRERPTAFRDPETGVVLSLVYPQHKEKANVIPRCTCKSVLCKTQKKWLCSTWHWCGSSWSLVSSSQHHALRKTRAGQGPKELIWKTKGLENAAWDKRVMEWVSSVWKWEDEGNLKTLNCQAEMWLLSAWYKLVMWSVMSTALCFCLVGLVHQDYFCSANLDHLLEHFQDFNMSLEEPDFLQIKVPQDSPQDLVLWPAFITNNCFWTHPVVWEILWLSPMI